MNPNPLLIELEHVRRRWGWLLVLGILMIVLGTVAFFLTHAATIGTVIVLGWLLVLSGVMETIHAFGVRRWGGVVLHVIGGVLGVLVGLLIVTHPLSGAVALTLLFAAFFSVIGIFRLIEAVALRFPHWGWAVFDGIITFALGLLLWIHMPWSGFWFLGLAVGFSLLFRGWSYIMLAIALRSMPLLTA